MPQILCVLEPYPTELGALSELQYRQYSHIWNI